MVRSDGLGPLQADRLNCSVSGFFGAFRSLTYCELQLAVSVQAAMMIAARPSLAQCDRRVGAWKIRSTMSGRLWTPRERLPIRETPRGVNVGRRRRHAGTAAVAAQIGISCRMAVKFIHGLDELRRLV